MIRRVDVVPEKPQNESELAQPRMLGILDWPKAIHA